MQARTEEYARLLRRFSANELAEAYTEVLQTWDNTAWPPPGRFFTAAMERRKTMERYRVPERRHIEHEPAGTLDLPHERVMAMLDELPGLSEHSRRALYRIGTGGKEPPWPAPVEKKPERGPSIFQRCQRPQFEAMMKRAAARQGPKPSEDA